LFVGLSTPTELNQHCPRWFWLCNHSFQESSEW